MTICHGLTMEQGLPEEIRCFQCNRTMTFGTSGIAYFGYSSAIYVCGKCSPGFAAGILHDASRLDSFLHISERHANHIYDANILAQENRQITKTHGGLDD